MTDSKDDFPTKMSPKHIQGDSTKTLKNRILIKEFLAVFFTQLKEDLDPELVKGE